jgi:WD40 repeat protein
LGLLSNARFAPLEAQQLDLVVQIGHTEEIGEVAFSPDGKIFASGGNDEKIILWSVDGARVIKTLIGHTKWVWGLTFSPDGKMLASGSIDNTIKLWNVETGQELKRPLMKHAETVKTESCQHGVHTIAI